MFCLIFLGSDVTAHDPLEPLHVLRGLAVLNPKGDANLCHPLNVDLNFMLGVD